MHLNALAEGDGPPVCLLHGLFGRLQNLGGVARGLAATHRVIRLDLRNHGASPHVAGMAYADMAAEMLERLRSLDALPCALLGHSMGGKVAMAAALSAPELVDRLIVADIAPVAYAHRNAAVAQALQALHLTPGLDRRAADAALTPAVPDPAVRAFLLQNLAFGSTPAWKIGLAEITAGLPAIEGWPGAFRDACYEGPALFVRGALSDYVAEDGVAALQKAFPNATLVSVAQAGHWVHAEAPEAFLKHVASFLQT